MIMEPPLSNLYNQQKQEIHFLIEYLAISSIYNISTLLLAYEWISE